MTVEQLIKALQSYGPECANLKVVFIHGDTFDHIGGIAKVWTGKGDGYSGAKDRGYPHERIALG